MGYIVYNCEQCFWHQEGSCVMVDSAIRVEDVTDRELQSALIDNKCPKAMIEGRTRQFNIARRELSQPEPLPEEC